MTNFVHALIAVLVGNAAYFVLMPYLPLPVRHVPFRTDLGLAVDGAICLAAFGIVKFLSSRKSESKVHKR